MAKKQTNSIVVYKRSLFGVLVKVAAYNQNQFEARISTCGVLRINKVGYDRGTITAAFAPGEWHVCKGFVADWSQK